MDSMFTSWCAVGAITLRRRNVLATRGREGLTKKGRGKVLGYLREGLKEVWRSVTGTMTSKQRESWHGWQRMKIGEVTGNNARKVAGPRP